MERQRYIVRLSKEERQELEAIVNKGKRDAHRISNAQILLHSDENGERLRVEAIAKLLHCNKDTVCEARKRLVERGFSAVLERKKRENPVMDTNRNDSIPEFLLNFYQTFCKNLST